MQASRGERQGSQRVVVAATAAAAVSRSIMQARATPRASRTLTRRTQRAATTAEARALF